ncbi:hypothetical protein [Sessilibacter sp. MAH2]
MFQEKSALFSADEYTKPENKQKITAVKKFGTKRLISIQSNNFRRLINLIKRVTKPVAKTP